VRGEILIPFKKSGFIREVIEDLKSCRDNDIRGYDDYSDDWYRGFKVGITNAIVLLHKHTKGRQ